MTVSLETTPTMKINEIEMMKKSFEAFAAFDACRQKLVNPTATSTNIPIQTGFVVAATTLATLAT